MQFSKWVESNDTSEPIVNFINILSSKFYVQKCFAQLSLVTFWLCNFLAQNIGAKVVRKIVDEIDT